MIRFSREDIAQKLWNFNFYLTFTYIRMVDKFSNVFWNILL